MKRQPKQPNFNALFFNLGAEKGRRRYELRFGTSHLPHDVIFLSSLLHDARLSISTVKSRGKKVSIELTRDLWELGALEAGRPFDLTSSDSRLSIAGVAGISWNFRDVVPLPEQELWIGQIRLDSKFGEPGYLLVLEGLGWQLQLTLADDGTSVTLQDVRSGSSEERGPG